LILRLAKKKLGILALLAGLVVVAIINAFGADFVSDDRGILINANSWTFREFFPI